MTQQAPLPYDSLEIGAHSASGGCHIYLTDKNGRKIAAIWGKDDEKAFTAHHLVTAANSHDALVKALEEMAPAVENLACHQVQCDMDGVMIQVSREALTIVLDTVNAMAALATVRSDCGGATP